MENSGPQLYLTIICINADRVINLEICFTRSVSFASQVFDLVKEGRRDDRKLADYEIAEENAKKLEYQTVYGNVQLIRAEEETLSRAAVATSPKTKSKFPKFWSSSNMGSCSKTATDSPTELSPMPNAHQSYANAAIASPNVNLTNGGGCGAAAGLEIADEKQRRRAFAHYDCQSLIAKLGRGGKLKNLLAKRRNTTTGASAASMIGTRSTTPDGDSGEEDAGDGRCNDLIER